MTWPLRLQSGKTVGPVHIARGTGLSVSGDVYVQYSRDPDPASASWTAWPNATISAGSNLALTSMWLKFTGTGEVRSYRVEDQDLPLADSKEWVYGGENIFNISPSSSAATNTTAIRAALDAGGMTLTSPGTYTVSTIPPSTSGLILGDQVYITDGTKTVDRTFYQSLRAVGGVISPALLSAHWPISEARIDADVHYPQRQLLEVPSPISDGTAYVIHPSVVDTVSGFSGYRYWMCYTPYPDPEDENPCIVASNDAVNWVVPSGLTNPVFARPSGTENNSDCFLAVTEDRRMLMLVWRDNVGATASLRISFSTDGITWSAKQQLFSVAAATDGMASPSLVYFKDKWRLFYHDSNGSPYQLKVRTADNLLDTGGSGTGTWSSATNCTLALAYDTAYWHSDIRVAPACDRLIGILSGQSSGAGAGSGGGYYLIESTDGETFSGSPLGTLVQGYKCGFFFDCDARGPRLMGYWGSISAQYTKVAPVYFDKTARLREVKDRAQIALGSLTAKAGCLNADNFNRSDGAVGTSSGGTAWTTLAGTLKVISNQCGADSVANHHSYLATTQANVEVIATIASFSETGNVSNQLTFRIRSAGADFIRIRFYDTGANTQKITAEAVVAGSAKGLVTLSNCYQSGYGVPSLVRVRLVDDRITVYMNEIWVGDYQMVATQGSNNIGYDVFPNTACLGHGIALAGTAFRFDDYVQFAAR